MNNIHSKLIKAEKGLSWNYVIEFRCICTRTKFPECKRSKLMSREDGPFQILERINDNVYKVDILSEYGVSATFNVFDLPFFSVSDDSRSNSFEERGDGVIQTIPEDL
jgi:hypothetical protein